MKMQKPKQTHEHNKYKCVNTTKHKKRKKIQSTKKQQNTSFCTKNTQMQKQKKEKE